MSTARADDVELAKVTRDVAAALESWWFRLFAGAHLSPVERERFRRLPLARLVDLIDAVFEMRQWGFDPVRVWEIRQAVRLPGEPDRPVRPVFPAGALFGPGTSPTAAPARSTAPRLAIAPE